MDPVSAAVVGWLAGRAMDAGHRQARRILRGDPQRNALRTVAREAIGQAVAQVVAADDLPTVREALLIEAPDTAELDVAGAVDLREAVRLQLEPRLVALAEQGYEIDAGQLSEALAGQLERLIQQDAAGGGPLSPLAEWLRHERMAQLGEETVRQLRTINRRLSSMEAPAPSQAGTRWMSLPVAGSDPLELGVHRVVDLDPPPAGTGELPAYVPRAHDRTVRQSVERAVDSSALVAVIGGSSTGKTRSLWEGIRALPDAWNVVWYPGGAAALHAALEQRSVQPCSVLWLDDAQHFLDPQLGATARENAVMLQELLASREVGPVLVAATLWPEHWQEFTVQAHTGAVEVQALLSRAVRVVVPDAFDTDALAAAHDVGRSDPRLGEAIRQATDGRLAQQLAGAPKLVERYETATADVKALVDVAIDAHRLGRLSSLPEALLVRAVPDYIHDDVWNRLGDDWPESALRTAVQDWRGLPGPLTRARPRPGEPVERDPRYLLADYLQQFGLRARRHICPPKAFWEAAAQLDSPAELAAIASAAEDRLRYRHAELLYRRAHDVGDPSALERLAFMWEVAGQNERATSLRERSIEAGEVSSLVSMAREWERIGEDGKALQLLQQAADGDDPIAWRAMAWVHANLKSLDDIEHVARRATEAGNPIDPVELARIWEHAGNSEQAEQLYRQIAEAGDSSALISLAWLRQKAGDHAAAELLAQQAEDAGSREATEILVRIREEAGDPVDAERIALKAADAGNTGALKSLAWMRQDAGDLAATERLLRAAATAGDAHALGNVAKMREEAGDYAEAERLAREATEAGDIHAPVHLARMREKAGAPDEAERIARQLVDAGRSGSLQMLALRCNLPECQRWLRYGLEPDGSVSERWW